MGLSWAQGIFRQEVGGPLSGNFEQGLPVSPGELDQDTVKVSPNPGNLSISKYFVNC